MTEMADTERARYIFRVKESSDGTPWIALEPRRDSLAVLGDGFLGLDLRPGIDLPKAKGIAEYLNEHIESVSYTGFFGRTDAPSQ